MLLDSGNREGFLSHDLLIRGTSFIRVPCAARATPAPVLEQYAMASQEPEPAVTETMVGIALEQPDFRGQI